MSVRSSISIGIPLRLINTRRVPDPISFIHRIRERNNGFGGADTGVSAPVPCVKVGIAVAVVIVMLVLVVVVVVVVVAGKAPDMARLVAARRVVVARLG